MIIIHILEPTSFDVLDYAIQFVWDHSNRGRIALAFSTVMFGGARGGALLAHNLAEHEPHSSSRLPSLSVNGLK